jgi:hypothetical protein
MTIKNQIGLDGDVTPPQYVSEVNLPSAETERVLLDWDWLKINRHRHYKYGMETQLTVKLPLKRRKFFDPAGDVPATGKPAYFLSFGRVDITHTGWHMRGAMTFVDIYHPPYVAPPPIGYKNPRNLANY